MDLRLFGPRVRDENQKSPHWACHRHLSMVGLFLLLVRQNRHHILSVWSGFFPCHNGIKGVLQNSSPTLLGLYLAWLHQPPRGVNLPNVGGQPTRMYQVRQWACNRHFGYGRTSALQYRLKSSTRVTLSSLSGTITGLRWKGRSLFQFLPDSSVSHLNYESRNFDIRYVGHQWAVFATSSRSSTERYVGHLLVVFATSWRSSTERNLHPGCGSYDLDHCHM